MDNLEKFIRDNRENLDKYEPSEKIWKEITKGLDKKRPIISVWLSAAAAIFLIIVIGTIIYSGLQGRKDVYSEMKGLPIGLKETEIYYNTMFNELYSEAKPLLSGNPEAAKELKTDMAQLDSIFADIKKDLKDNVANQEVIEALVQNYRIRLQLLEEMLKVLKESEKKPDKVKKHEL